MSLLDLDPGSLPLGAWTGDGTWAVTPTGATVAAVDEGGLTVLRLASSSGGSPAEVVAMVTPPADWTVHLVAALDGAPESPSPGGYWSNDAPLLCTPGFGWLLGVADTGPVPGRHVVTVTSAGDLYVDGGLVGNAGPAALNPAVKVATYGGPTHTWTLARLLLEDGISPTLAADMAALVDEYGDAPLTAHGAWEISGVVALSGSEVFDPPVTPPTTPGGSITPPSPPEPQLPPAGVPDAVIRRYSETMPTPVLDARSWPTDWAPTSVVDAEYGRVQVVVEGVDVTYHLGVPMEFPSWSRTEPFGSSEATLRFPQITAFHALPAWCVPGASVDIRIAKTAGGVVSRFAGVVVSFGHSEDDGVFTINATGAVMADDMQLRQPSFLTAPRDIGDVIAEVLNTAVSRRHSPVSPVVTGCLTSVLGGWEPRVTGYVQQLLATAVSGGRQWTVRCDERAPVIALKDTTTIQWTVHNGQRGVQIDLAQDWSQAPNVLYGEGIGSDGGRWRNARYPNWRPDDTPPYPNANPSKTIRVGTTDSMTDTGSGVSDWQRRVGLPATGRFAQVDKRKAIEVQTAAGIQRDGIVGPQTWAATFGTGSNTGTLECFYMPLAYSPAVMPRLYGPDGDDLGPNPAYSPNTLRVEEKIDFGQGVSKDEGTRAAGEMLARDIHPGWTGTVTFADVDPQERSRFEIQEGLNGRIRGYRGTDLVVHAAAVDYSEDSVTVTVDTNARDYPTLDAIRDRERNATDPAKAAVKRLSKGSVTDARATFDAESPAGHIPRFALFSNLWSVIRVPFGSYGSVVRTEITTDAAREFSVAVFNQPITAARLLSLVGNPLTAEENPWSNEDLDDAGMLMSWGWYQQPAGYWPGEYSDPDGETTAPLTGKLVDDASWDYASTQAPWLWVGLIASGSCYIEGRFWPGAD